MFFNEYPEPYQLCWAEIDLLNFPRFIKFSISSGGLYLSFPAFSISCSKQEFSCFINIKELDGIMRYLSEIEKEIIKKKKGGN